MSKFIPLFCEFVNQSTTNVNAVAPTDVLVMDASKAVKKYPSTCCCIRHQHYAACPGK